MSDTSVMQQQSLRLSLWLNTFFALLFFVAMFSLGCAVLTAPGVTFEKQVYGVMFNGLNLAWFLAITALFFALLTWEVCTVGVNADGTFDPVSAEGRQRVPLEAVISRWRRYAFFASLIAFLPIFLFTLGTLVIVVVGK